MDLATWVQVAATLLTFVGLLSIIKKDSKESTQRLIDSAAEAEQKHGFVLKQIALLTQRIEAIEKNINKDDLELKESIRGIYKKLDTIQVAPANLMQRHVEQYHK